MSQLSRPYQVLLAGVLVLALGWFVLIHDHHSEANPPATGAQSPAHPAQRLAVPTQAPARSRAQSSSSAARSSLPGLEGTVKGELAKGKDVLILFWNPGSALDQTVRDAVETAAQNLGPAVAVHFARANQVSSFGTITRAVTVTQTPMLLIINPRGEIATTAGLTDAFGIEQRVSEASSRRA